MIVVPTENVQVNYLAVGDVVTFSYENKTGQTEGILLILFILPKSQNKTIKIFFFSFLRILLSFLIFFLFLELVNPIIRRIRHDVVWHDRANSNKSSMPGLIYCFIFLILLFSFTFHTFSWYLSQNFFLYLFSQNF